MFWYLVLVPTAGALAGIALLASHDGFGGLLIVASLIGAWRVHGSARRALRAARQPTEQPRRPLDRGNVFVMARTPQGRFLGLPFNWSRPARRDLGRGVWDPEDGRVVTPKNYGWGYGINFAALIRRARRR